ncbi:hypothetical protein HDU81_000066 [Chytriomyces hyalinus]|nr:hypothetical protein HDU81_000066 [Chytriomyces hyalinus]
MSIASQTQTPDQAPKLVSAMVRPESAPKARRSIVFSPSTTTSPPSPPTHESLRQDRNFERRRSIAMNQVVLQHFEDEDAAVRASLSRKSSVSHPPTPSNTSNFATSTISCTPEDSNARPSSPTSRKSVTANSFASARVRLRSTINRITRTIASDERRSIERTLEQIKAGATVFLKHGKEMWSRETQTTELSGVDLQDVYHISNAIKKDLEISRAIMSVTCSVKLQEAHVLLYTVMAQKLKQLDLKFAAKLKQEKAARGIQLRERLQEARRIFEAESSTAIQVVTDTTRLEANKKRQVLDRVQVAFEERNQEFHRLQFISARQYLSLKRNNIQGVLEVSLFYAQFDYSPAYRPHHHKHQPNEKEDVAKLQLATHIEQLHGQIIKLDEDIRLLRPKLFQLEEEVDKNTQAGLSSKASSMAMVTGIVNETTTEEDGRVRTTTRYVKYPTAAGSNPSSRGGVTTASAFLKTKSADSVTRDTVRKIIVQQFEEFLEQSLAPVATELADLQATRGQIMNDWDVKFKSIAALGDRSKLNRVLGIQSKFLRWAIGLVQGKLALKEKADAKTGCQLLGMNLVDLYRQELVEFKLKFGKVLVQLEKTMLEREQKEMERKRELERKREQAEAEAKKMSAFARRQSSRSSAQFSKSRSGLSGMPFSATKDQSNALSDCALNNITSSIDADMFLGSKAYSVITPSAALLIPDSASGLVRGRSRTRLVTGGSEPAKSVIANNLKAQEQRGRSKSIIRSKSAFGAYGSNAHLQRSNSTLTVKRTSKSLEPSPLSHQGEAPYMQPLEIAASETVPDEVAIDLTAPSPTSSVFVASRSRRVSWNPQMFLNESEKFETTAETSEAHAQDANADAKDAVKPIEPIFTPRPRRHSFASNYHTPTPAEFSLLPTQVEASSPHASSGSRSATSMSRITQHSSTPSEFNPEVSRSRSVTASMMTSFEAAKQNLLTPHYPTAGVATGAVTALPSRAASATSMLNQEEYLQLAWNSARSASFFDAVTPSRAMQLSIASGFQTGADWETDPALLWMRSTGMELQQAEQEEIHGMMHDFSQVHRLGISADSSVGAGLYYHDQSEYMNYARMPQRQVVYKGLAGVEIQKPVSDG